MLVAGLLLQVEASLLRAMQKAVPLAVKQALLDSLAKRATPAR